MSLKDQFNLKGLDSTLGYVGRALKPAAADALMVDVLKGLGAIIVAKTNLPQSILVSTTTPERDASDMTSGPRLKILSGA